MRSFTPAIVVCLAGLALMIGAGIASATAPPSRGGEAVPERALIGASSGPPRLQGLVAEARLDPYWRIAHKGISAQLAP